MIALERMPHGISEIRGFYGNPDHNEDWVLDAGWLELNTDVFSLPWPLDTWNGKWTTMFRAHKKVGAVIADAIADAGLHNVFWGGCWWFRKMHAYPALSTHSWGIAVDLNPAVASWGADPSTQNAELVKAFKDRGFDWGGDWPPDYPSDPMHFQACTGY